MTLGLSLSFSPVLFVCFQTSTRARFRASVNTIGSTWPRGEANRATSRRCLPMIARRGSNYWFKKRKRETPLDVSERERAHSLSRTHTLAKEKLPAEVFSFFSFFFLFLKVKVAQAKEPPGVPKYSCMSQKVSEVRKRKSRPRAALHRLCGGISRSKVRSNGRPWPRRKTNAVMGSSRALINFPPEPNPCVTVEATQRHGILEIQC